ncbi:MAG TPA: Ig-like domain-containing protein [Gaiellaceae bacterium]|nr:Ig-like domain-containing protein [Gaiellaceae bacterium]
MSERAPQQAAWRPRPFQAALVRILAFVVPVAASIGFVRVVGTLVSPPADSFWLFIGWWCCLTAAATVVLVLVGRVTRRLLPLATLLKLSLVFPDEAPSRFKTALRSGTTDTLEERIAAARSGRPDETPVEAAQRLLTLVSALDAHDALTRGHSERVRAYAQMIGKELGLDHRALDRLNWAALLHDVGKLDVPLEILQKPGRPTDEEWAQLRRHPELGAQLVAPLHGWLGEWAEAVPQHHEHWDGRGYPAGKSGDEIALAGRIVAVADVFDVMTSARSYKEAGDSIAAREELARMAGTQFDPRVVRAFLNVSLGRLRLAMGPLSWLAHAPLLGKIPLTPLTSAVGSVSGSLAVVATATTTGIVGTPHLPAVQIRTPAAQAAPLTPAADPVSPAPARSEPRTTRVAAAFVALERTVQQSKTLVVRLPRIGSEQSVRIVERPAAGTVSVAQDGSLVYRAPADYTGEVRIGYRACSDDGRCVRGVVRVEVRAADATSAPVAERPREEQPPRPSPAEPKPAEQRASDRGQPSPQPSPPPVSAAPLNRPPTASDDAAAVVAGQDVEIDLLANDRDPDGDGLTLSSVAQPSAGSVERLTGGRIRFRAAHGSRGSLAFSYTVSDPSGSSARATVTVRVAAQNAAPAFMPGPDVTVRENTGRTVVTGWASQISIGEGDTGQSVSFSVDSDAAGLFTPDGQPSLAADGTLSFTPAPDANGQAHVTVRARDDGGTADGGSDTSAAHTSTIVVTPVNSPPSFTSGADVVVAEDSGPYVTAGWASAISPGPSDEVTQSVSFLVDVDDPSLFTAGGKPKVGGGGTLTFEPAANAHGVAHVTVRARDDGGTGDGGVDTSAAHALLITLTAVADAPVAAADTPSTVEDSAGITFDVLANDMDPDGDTLTVQSFDSSSLTLGTLVHDGGGGFTYTPTPSANGTDSFTYTVADGSGRTSTASVTIAVAAQPDAPSAADDAYVTTAGVPVVIGAPGLLSNDGDEDGDTLGINLAASTAPANGSLSLSTDGSFTYTPNVGFSGTDTFTYKVTDGALVDVGTVTITVSATPVLSSTFFFTPTGGPDIWDLSASPPPAATPVPDYEGDGNPGLTVEKSDGKLTVLLGLNRRREWVYPVTTPLVLNGPVSVELWSVLADFEINHDAHPHIYLFDCAAGGSGCVQLAANDIHVNDWNTSPTWMQHVFTVGSVSRTIVAGRELRLRLLVGHRDIWLAMTASYPSALHVTLG